MFIYLFGLKSIYLSTFLWKYKPINLWCLEDDKGRNFILLLGGGKWMTTLQESHTLISSKCNSLLIGAQNMNTFYQPRTLHFRLRNWEQFTFWVKWKVYVHYRSNFILVNISQYPHFMHPFTKFPWNQQHYPPEIEKRNSRIHRDIFNLS